MHDIVTEIYYLVDEALPMGPRDPAVEDRLLDTLTPEQEAYLAGWQG